MTHGVKRDHQPHQETARGRSHLLRATLTDLERQLDASRFRRIHRTTLVNIDRVREIRSDPSGDSDVLLDSGTVLRMSRRFRDQLLPRS
jgi:two-component system LytT family response regulator